MTEKTLGGDEFGRDGSGRGSEERGLADYLGICRRRIWIMLTAFVLVVTLGTVWVFKTVPTYESAAKLLIERQTPQPTNFEEVVQAPVSEREYYRTQRELVVSRTVLERAAALASVAHLPEIAGETDEAPSFASQVKRSVQAIIGSPPAKPPKPWERLRDRLDVRQVKATHLITITAESAAAERAAALANAVATAFRGYHLERKAAVSDDAFKFLQEQKEKQEKRLLAAEDALQGFREKAKVVSLNVEDKANPVLYLRSRLNEQLIEARLQRVELEARCAVVKEAVAACGGHDGSDNMALLSLPCVRADPSVTRLQADLLEAHKQADAASTAYGPKHHSVRAAKQMVGRIRGELSDAIEQVVASLRAKLGGLISQEDELERQYTAQTQRALELSRKSLAYTRLENEANRHRKLFDVLVERMREVDVTSDYVKANVEVIERAGVPSAPARPRKALLVTLFALLGIVLSVGLAFLFEHIDDTVKTPEDLENRVGVSVLGFVPSMEADEVEREGDLHRGLVALTDPSSHITEAYRSIRTSLFYSAPPEESKAVVVTSGSPGDGKTTSALNLALVVAQSGKRVLLIDADLRRPMIAKMLGLSAWVGLSTVLVGEATLDGAVQRAIHEGEAVANLDVLASGPKPPNPAELLDSQSMRALLEEARTKYDRIILDSPPVLAFADGSIVSGISDGVILVVKSATNPRSLAIRAREELEGVNARILGGILNDVHVRRLGDYDSKYSYYAYSQYHGDDYYSSKGGGTGDPTAELDEVAAELDRVAGELEKAAAELEGQVAAVEPPDRGLTPAGRR